LPVAEEAAVTAKIRNRVERIVDVGVAGVHRLFDKLDLIRGARVVVVLPAWKRLAQRCGGLGDNRSSRCLLLLVMAQAFMEYCFAGDAQ